MLVFTMYHGDISTQIFDQWLHPTSPQNYPRRNHHPTVPPPVGNMVCNEESVILTRYSISTGLNTSRSENQGNVRQCHKSTIPSPDPEASNIDNIKTPEKSKIGIPTFCFPEMVSLQDLILVASVDNTEPTYTELKVKGPPGPRKQPLATA